MHSIETYSERVLFEIEQRNVVFTAPTGAGKSTLLPQWLSQRGSVLVIEPRRIAAQALAQRVAHLMSSRIGAMVGFHVRDNVKKSPDTKILFVTTGIALRMMANGAHRDFATVILDEFHERSLDLDLILALLLKDKVRILVCSATMQAQKIAQHIEGHLIEVTGRQFEVAVTHSGNNRLPSEDQLAQRVKNAVEQLPSGWRCLLVFLPGKAEIRRTGSALDGTKYEILQLDGSQSLSSQNEVFKPLGAKPRVVLSTNIAETSLTIPSVDGVIDSGLVRRTRYYAGRGFLTLLPIALDSAMQRSGRAGRVKSGFAIRLWADSHALEQHSLPEIRRDSLNQLLLSSLCCGHHPNALPFLEQPPVYALAHSTESLSKIGAIDTDGNLTSRGRLLFNYPLDPFLNALLIQAEQDHTLYPMVHICAALSTQRSFFMGRGEDQEKDLRKEGCDLLGIIKALEQPRCPENQVYPAAWEAAKAHLSKLSTLFKVQRTAFDIVSVRQSILRAWPGVAHVKRQRKRNISWANGGTEKSLALGSAIDTQRTEVILALSSIALSGRRHHAEAMITLASPIPAKMLYSEGLTHAVLEGVKVIQDSILAVYSHRYAKRTILTQESEPPQALVISTIVRAILENRWRPEGARALRQHHCDRSLAAQLAGEPPLPPLNEWLGHRLKELGVVECDDMALLDDEDWSPSPLDDYSRRQLRKHYPAQLSTGDAHYEMSYDPIQRVCSVIQTSGLRKNPPEKKNLPKLRGWKFLWVYKNRPIPLG
ncbi:MAG: DEAD/DEAH box helicase [Myxococcota bacterium]|nr:DEAD/DEAH box helicase [Myxococcota bacterium]